MLHMLAGRRLFRGVTAWLLGLFLLLFAHPPAWAALATDVVVSTNRSAAASAIASPSFSTSSPGELLLAFVATDARSTGMAVTSMSGAGLSWTLVRRTNAQPGTAEIWRAFAPSRLSGASVQANLSQSVAASLTVVSFTGADPSGSGAGAIGATGSGNASAGAPSASLVTTRANSWVFGVGSDYDNAVARTVPAGQNLVNQYLANVGDTYWVQRQNTPTSASGTTVTINDTSPTADRYNLTVVEVRAPPSSASYAVSGNISPAALGAGAAVSLSQGASMVSSTSANATGAFSFASVPDGTYTVTPSKAGVNFSPASRNVTVNGAAATVAAFTAATGMARLPDLSVIIPPGRMSIVGSGSSRMFQYTHDTFNGGNGPLVIQPQYNPASGLYLGTQYLYSYATGTWTLSHQVPVAGAFMFHAEHGHFHFPFVTFGLYAQAANGGPGVPVAISEKNGFCIADSFIYAPGLPNAGAIGNLGACSDPTSLRGLDIGAVDEYDRSDPGQSISLANVPDGTYWLRAIVDPENFLAESDESNNETDVLLTISGNTVTEVRQVKPTLPAPPAISLTFPVDLARVSGTINLQASAPTGARVQYLLNGQPLGNPVPAPFTLQWNTATAADGSNWLAVQTTDPSTGRTGTSRVARVTVANGGTRPPAVTVASPEPGATVSSVTVLSATVSSSARVTGVQFFVDGSPVGARLTSAPYLLYWDSRAAAAGSHAVAVSATDAYGLTGTSNPVTFTVDNSRPPNKIGIDAKVSVDGAGVMTTPAFSTATSSDFLVAFVAYDGPPDTAQSANVSGAGLPWTLIARSNSQRGTSEIWAVKTHYVLSSATVTAQPTAVGFHGSLVVMAFTNAAGPGVVGRAGAPSGPPDLYLPGVSAGNWVFAVGNDWDHAIARVPVSGQVLVHQRLDTQLGDTFWVQSTTAPSTANTLVDIHDTSPTTDQWNYAAMEIVATRP